MVTVGFSGEIWSSDESEIWTRRSTSFSGSPLEEIAYADGRYVTVSSSLNAGSLGGIFVSGDAVGWTHIAAGQDMGGVVHGDGRFVAVGSTFHTFGNMAVYTSSNGLDFVTVDLGLNGKVAFLGMRTDIPLLLNIADLVVLPSRWERSRTSRVFCRSCSSMVAKA